jgi:hypothetical protein
MSSICSPSGNMVLPAHSCAVSGVFMLQCILPCSQIGSKEALTMLPIWEHGTSYPLLDHLKEPLRPSVPDPDEPE